MIGEYYILFNFPLNSTQSVFPITEPKDIYEEFESGL